MGASSKDPPEEPSRGGGGGEGLGRNLYGSSGEGLVHRTKEKNQGQKHQDKSVESSGSSLPPPAGEDPESVPKAFGGISNSGTKAGYRKAKAVFNFQEIDDSNEPIPVHVDLRSLPDFQKLVDDVSQLVDNMSWIESHGIHTLRFFIAALCIPLSILYFLPYSSPYFIIGILLQGYGFMVLGQSAGHLGVHGSLGISSKRINSLVCTFLAEFIGSFSVEAGYDIHIKCHHPHTNIIGLGDSSSWRAPFLPVYIYMFVAPIVMTWIAPLLIFYLHWGEWKKMLKCSIFVAAGICLQTYAIMLACQIGAIKAYAVMALGRSVFSLPYIHINIFQHIGLPMWDRNYRPKRVYQMSHGCLNLSRNPVLDLVFGHTLVNCHVEHHLFPKLSDSQCMKIKPLVRKYLLDNNLPYHEESYWSRLKIFVSDYERLMVHAPPILQFVGFQ